MLLLTLIWFDKLLVDVRLVLNLNLAQTVQVWAVGPSWAAGVLSCNHICCFTKNGARTLADCRWLLLLVLERPPKSKQAKKSNVQWLLACHLGACTHQLCVGG